MEFNTMNMRMFHLTNPGLQVKKMDWAENIQKILRIYRELQVGWLVFVKVHTIAGRRADLHAVPLRNACGIRPKSHRKKTCGVGYSSPAKVMLFSAIRDWSILLIVDLQFPHMYKYIPIFWIPSHWEGIFQCRSTKLAQRVSTIAAYNQYASYSSHKKL